MNATGPDAACRPCVVGVDCSAWGSELTHLELRPGYWRPSADSVDVRRCRDGGLAIARDCEPSHNASELAACETRLSVEISLSGCQGGADVESQCGPGLNGPFCKLCRESNITSSRLYVRPASESLQRAAKCASCDEDGVVLGYSAFYACLAMCLLLAIGANHRVQEAVPSLVRYWHACKPLVKLKARTASTKSPACYISSSKGVGVACACRCASACTPSSLRSRTRAQLPAGPSHQPSNKASVA